MKTNPLKKKTNDDIKGFKKDCGKEYAKIIHKGRNPNGQLTYEEMIQHPSLSKKSKR